nr:dolichol kinase EVAN-like [Coffea arabica]
MDKPGARQVPIVYWSICFTLKTRFLNFFPEFFQKKNFPVNGISHLQPEKRNIGLEEELGGMAVPAALQWMNGERGVLVLYIARILYAAPISLLAESIALGILSLFALSLEISADHDHDRDPFSRFFKTRPGVSSGILLGAVTLPGLMLSRLIQMLRGLSLNEVGVAELENLQLQYWATFASCFSVLVCFHVILQRQDNGVPSVDSCSNWNKRFSLSCIALCAGICCIAFSAKYQFGWQMVFMLLWVVFHGLVASKLIQRILRTFPACVSIGEALLVTSGLVIYFGDMLQNTVAKIFGYWTSLGYLPVQYVVKRSEISTIIQGMTVGLLLFPLFLKLIFQISGHFKFVDSSRERANHEMKKSFIFYASLAFLLIVVIPLWMQFVHDFHMHPLFWVLDFVFSEPLKTLSLCTYWIALIYASVTRFYDISKNSKTERILLRKYYHLMAVVIFVPALILQPEFLDLAFGAALAVFLILEIIRVWRIWPLGQLVHQFMNAFTDHRDSEILVISHFSLLLGCALPIWLSSGFNDRPLAPFAGILSLGIGDTMASMVGHKYGVLRWSKTGKKTIEGTAAGITSVLVACSVLLPLLATTGNIFSQHWFSLLVAVTTSGLLEAYTAQLDNAFIPLVFYSLLCL